MNDEAYMAEINRLEGERDFWKAKAEHPVQDSRVDTSEHIRHVVRAIHQVVCELLHCCANWHDQSKLVPPEKDVFDEVTQRLAGLTYGSEEYKKQLAELAPALKHHYENNRHHPEHFESGIDGMTLADVVEMFCDWYAAGKRHNDGDILKSIEVNEKRFKIDKQLVAIFRNTAIALGWTNHEEHIS